MNGRQATFLDITRTVAAQSVLVGHIYTTFVGEPPVKLGNFGVLLFFVLSGFLICYTVLEKRAHRARYDLRVFFYDRFFRIFVAFVPAVILVLLLDGAVIAAGKVFEYREYFTVRDFIGTLFMLAQNPLGLLADQLLHLPQLKIATFGSARPLWTVAIEWWLYLFFGWMVLKADMVKSAPITFIGVCALLGIVPLFNAVAGTGEGLTLIWFTAAGMAYLLHRYRADIHAWLVQASAGRYLGPLMLGSVAVLLGMLMVRMFWVSFVLPGFNWEPFHFYDVSFGLLLLMIFFVLMLWFEQGGKSRRSRAAKFFSDYSYSLYLIHYSLIVFLTAFGMKSTSLPATALGYFVACNVAAIAFWWAFERHYPVLKRAWLNRKAA